MKNDQMETRAQRMRRQMDERAALEASRSIGARYRYLPFDPMLAVLPAFSAASLAAPIGYGALREACAAYLPLPEVGAAAPWTLAALLAALCAYRIFDAREVPSSNCFSQQLFLGFHD